MDLEIIERILTIAMGVLVSLFFLDLYLRSRILQRLRNSHEQVWKDLGSPSLWLNNSFQNGWATLRFLWGKRKHSVNDPYLHQLMRRERGLHIIQGAVLLLGLVLMALAFYLR